MADSLKLNVPLLCATFKNPTKRFKAVLSLSTGISTNNGLFVSPSGTAEASFGASATGVSATGATATGATATGASATGATATGATATAATGVSRSLIFQLLPY